MTPFFLRQVGVISIIFLVFIISLLITVKLFKKQIEQRKASLAAVEGYNVVRYKHHVTPRMLSKVMCTFLILFVGIVMAQFEVIAKDYVYLLLFVTFCLQLIGIDKNMKKSGIIAMMVLFIIGGILLQGHYQFIADLNHEPFLRSILFISECCYGLLFMLVYVMIVQLMWKPQRQKK